MKHLGLALLFLLAAVPATAGDMASDFTFKDINPASATYGSDITLSEAYAENGVVLNFLASWCGYCWQELPILQELADSGTVKVLGMAADEYGEPADVLMELIARKGLTLPILWVEPEAAAELEKRYTYQTLPATYLIQADGTIGKILTGAVEPEQLREEIARTLR